MNHFQSISSQQEQYDPFFEFLQKEKKKWKKHKKIEEVELDSAEYSTIDQNDYQVQQIKAKRYINRKVQYLIAWVGYEGMDTWQFKENLKHIQGMINDFETKYQLSQTKKKSCRLSINPEYQYDFSKRGQNLTVIDDQPQPIQTQQPIVPQEEEQIELSYVSSQVDERQLSQNIQQILRNKFNHHSQFDSHQNQSQVDDRCEKTERNSSKGPICSPIQNILNLPPSKSPSISGNYSAISGQNFSSKSIEHNPLSSSTIILRPCSKIKFFKIINGKRIYSQ